MHANWTTVIVFRGLRVAPCNGQKTYEPSGAVSVAVGGAAVADFASASPSSNPPKSSPESTSSAVPFSEIEQSVAAPTQNTQTPRRNAAQIPTSAKW
jgi:hypothetical protein